MSDYIKERESEKNKFNLISASYTAWQINLFNGSIKTNSFGTYLNKLGLKMGKSEKLTKEDMQTLKDKSMAVVNRISKMKGLRKG